MNWLRTRAHFIEMTVAGWLTLMLGVIHLAVLNHAGPLWRDEISSVRLATMPTLSSFWSSLAYDPFPAFYFLILRGWRAIGLANIDFDLRILGCLIGLALIAAIWWSCWRINRSAPLWPLVLFALNPITFEFGDSIRAYGVGLIWIVLSFACIWDITFRPLRRGTVFLAFTAAILSVQTLFTNALILFAICSAGLIICLRRKWWGRTALLLGIGATAAASLLIYLPIFRRTHEWSMLCVESTSYRGILTNYSTALGIGTGITLYFWIGLMALGLTATLVAQIRTKRWQANQDRRDQLLFGAIVLVGATTVMTVFFERVGWFTSSWYFLPLMAVSVMSLHTMTTAVVKIEWRILAPIAVSVLSLLMVPSITQHVYIRKTNADIMAAAVAQRATKEDLVLVSPYFYAVSFQRYYHGTAPWTALPCVDDYSLHRWDLLKRAMETPDAVSNVLERVRATLDAGHTVYLVGGFPPKIPLPPAPLAAAPNTPSGWSFQAYVRNWGQQTSQVVYQHPTRATLFLVKETPPISSLENLHVIAVSGRAESIATAK